MAITLHLQHLSAEQVSLTYSPGWEALVSLHVLDDPNHHPVHIPWVIRADAPILPITDELASLRGEPDRYARGGDDPSPDPPAARPAQPLYRELAGLLRLSEAAVSKHLKLLQEAGLVVPERDSYYVLYRVVREPLAAMARGLNAILSGQEHFTS